MILSDPSLVAVWGVPSSARPVCFEGRVGSLRSPLPHLVADNDDNGRNDDDRDGRDHAERAATSAGVVRVIERKQHAFFSLDPIPEVKQRP